MNETFRTRDVTRARRLLDNLIRRLAQDHPGSAASLKEDLDEPFTVKRLGLDVLLERMLSTANVIEHVGSDIRGPVSLICRSGTALQRGTTTESASATACIVAPHGVTHLPGMIPGGAFWRVYF